MHVIVTGEDEDVFESMDDENDDVYEIDDPDDETEDGEFPSSMPSANGPLETAFNDRIGFVAVWM